MLLDYLANADRYAPLNERLAEGFAFLRRDDLAGLPDGRHAIAGDEAFAIVARQQGRGRERSLLETHRRYLDIQYVVSGVDSIGYLPHCDCRRISSPYDPETDLEFYFDRPETWLRLTAGMFAVFFPADAHAPLAAAGEIHKVVVKLAVD